MLAKSWDTDYSQKQIHAGFLVGNEFDYQKETLNFSTACLARIIY